MKTKILLLALIFPVLCQAQTESSDKAPTQVAGSSAKPTDPLVLYKYYLVPVDDPYGVSIYTAPERLKVELSKDKEKQTLWTSDDTGGGHQYEVDALAAPSGEYIVIITPHPNQTPSNLLLFKRKKGLSFVQTDEKIFQREFDRLMKQKPEADHYGINLKGWSVIEDGEELAIEYIAASAPPDRHIVDQRTLLFNPKTGTFREKK